MDKNLQSAVDLIHDAAERFGKQLPTIEKKLLDEVLNLTKDLEVKNGRIITNTANLKLINRIKNKLNRAILNKGYLKEVGGLTNAIGKIKDFQDNYYTNFGQNANNKLFDTLKQQAVDNVVEGLAGQGLARNVSNSIANILRQSIISGANLSEMTQQLTTDLAADGGGRLSRYAKTYATDAIGQFAGEYNKAIADDLGLDWFMYVGSNLTTTREFCEHLRKKKYIHKSELPDILKGKIDGHQCEIYQKTGLPKGMIEGTNVDNFIIRRGGYNCGHEMVPVAREAVPPQYQIKIAQSESTTMDDVSNKIADKLDVKVTPVNMKSEARIIEKANADYNRDVSKVKDIVRNTFIADNSKIDSVIEAIKKNFDIDRVKKQNDVRMGYSGTIINVKNKNGTISEIQVNTPQMIYAKDENAKSILGAELYNKIKTATGLESGLGHKLYEKHRMLNPDNADDRKLMTEIEAESRSYYEKIKRAKI
jgi:hypothetical protein